MQGSQAPWAATHQWVGVRGLLLSIVLFCHPGEAPGDGVWVPGWHPALRARGTGGAPAGKGPASASPNVLLDRNQVPILALVGHHWEQFFFLFGGSSSSWC